MNYLVRTTGRASRSTMRGVLYRAANTLIGLSNTSGAGVQHYAGDTAPLTFVVRNVANPIMTIVTAGPYAGIF